MGSNACQNARSRRKRGIVHRHGCIASSPDAGYGCCAPLVDLDIWAGRPVLVSTSELTCQRSGRTGPRRREHRCQFYDAAIRQANAVKRWRFTEQLDDGCPFYNDPPRGKGLEVNGIRLELPLREVGGRPPIRDENRLMR